MHFVRAWLKHARTTDDPAGDLIADMRHEVRRDPASIPRLFGNVGEMRGYLRQQGACREALDAVPVVWRRYSSWLARNPTGKTRKETQGVAPW